MKKPKDVTELASRLANAAAMPLVAPAQVPSAPKEAFPAPLPEKRRKTPNRGSVAVFLRLSQPLYEHYDAEAVRRTKETGRGVTVQQVILDRLAEAQP
jgi:hypothetical protein